MKRKKLIILICFLVLMPITTLLAQNINQYVAESVEYKILINGVEKEISDIVSIENRTYVPIRELCKSLGYDVEWNGDTQSIAISSSEDRNSKNWIVYEQNGKRGYMDRFGNIMIKAEFDWANEFVDGIAVVGNFVEGHELLSTKDNQIIWGYINEKGELITEIKFDYAGEFNEGLATVVEKDGPAYYIDVYGNKSSQEYLGTKYFTKGFMPKIVNDESDWYGSTWSYIDSAGRCVMETVFEEAHEFDKNGLAIVKKYGKYGVINEKFETVIDYIYDDIREYDSNLFRVKSKGKWGVVNAENEVIIDFDFFSIDKFHEGLAAVRKSIDDGAYMNQSGKLFLESKFSMVYGFENGVACVVDKSSNKAGIIDSSGEYVIEPQYYSLIPAGNGLFQACEKQGGEKYFINIQNEIIVPH